MRVSHSTLKCDCNACFTKYIEMWLQCVFHKVHWNVIAMHVSHSTLKCDCNACSWLDTRNLAQRFVSRRCPLSAQSLVRRRRWLLELCYVLLWCVFECLVQVYMSRSSDKGQGHRSKRLNTHIHGGLCRLFHSVNCLGQYVKVCFQVGWSNNATFVWPVLTCSQRVPMLMSLF